MIMRAFAAAVRRSRGERVSALHTELAEQAEQLTRGGERQRELLATEQAARAGAEAARARLAFLSHVSAVLGASLDHRQVVSRLTRIWRKGYPVPAIRRCRRV